MNGMVVEAGVLVTCDESWEPEAFEPGAFSAEPSPEAGAPGASEASDGAAAAELFPEALAAPAVPTA